MFVSLHDYLERTMLAEQGHLLPLSKDAFDLAEVSYAVVDSFGCIRQEDESLLGAPEAWNPYRSPSVFQQGGDLARRTAHCLS